MNDKEIQDLGYANGWGETKEIVDICESLKHKKEIIRIGQCLTQYICRECGYSYKVDSTD